MNKTNIIQSQPCIDNKHKPEHTNNEYFHNDFATHLHSPYCITRRGINTSWAATIICLPCKLIIFSPCHIGAVYNSCINCYNKSHK